MQIRFNNWAFTTIIPYIIALSALNSSAEPSLNDIHQTQKEKIKLMAENHQSIEVLDQETNKILSDHEKNLEEIESLKKYNSLLREQIKAQVTQINSAEARINKIAVTERKIPPLFLDMIEDLEGSIDQSLPFQKTERRHRIEQLKVLMKRPNLSLSEQYQQILEAYRVESNYGKTMTTYRDAIVLDGEALQVDILQLGRLALFFSTLSRERIGMWDASKQSWIELNQSSFKKNIRSAINIAKGNEPEDLLVLPFPSSSLKIKTEE